MKPCPAPQLIESEAHLTVKTWLHGITTTEVQQKPLIPLIPPGPHDTSLVHATWVPQGTAPRSHTSSQTPNRRPSNTGPWQSAPSICLPSLCYTEYHRRTGVEDTEVVQGNFRQLNRFLSPTGQMLVSKMSHIAWLSWRSCSSTSSPNPSLLTSMWFCFKSPFLL